MKAILAIFRFGLLFAAGYLIRNYWGDHSLYTIVITMLLAYIGGTLSVLGERVGHRNSYITLTGGVLLIVLATLSVIAVNDEATPAIVMGLSVSGVLFSAIGGALISLTTNSITS